jgi:hypothetical protein
MVSQRGNLGFAQFANASGIAMEVGCLPASGLGWSIGWGLDYLGALSSAIGPSAPLAVPGFDALRLGLSAGIWFPEGLVLRAGPHAAFAQVHMTGLSHFWLGADLSAGWLFRLDWLGLEPGLAVSCQFRHDLGLVAMIGAQLRISLLGEALPRPIPPEQETAEGDA